jgi:hypothetical protein
MSEDNAAYVQAIVSSGTRKLVCKIWDKASPGNVYMLKDCYEFYSNMMLLPTPKGLGLSYKSTIVPVDIEEEPVDVLAMVDNIRFFHEMKDSGLKYTNMIAEYEDTMLKNRAGRANLSIERDMPDGKGKLIL